METKLCVFCRHWHFDPGEPDWSNITSGESYAEGCRKRHWEITYRDTEYSYREKILKAETCRDFSHIKDE